MRYALALVLPLLPPGCAFEAHVAADAGMDVGRTESSDAAGFPDNAFVDLGLGPLPPVCGGHACAADEVCCVLDLRCVAPGDPSCAPPPDAPSGACASNADCALGESCQVLDARGNWMSGACGGLGTCWTQDFSCGGSGDGVCGCDGRTYLDLCDLASHRVRPVADVPCGGELDAMRRVCEVDADCVHGHCDPLIGCVHDDPLVACGLDAQCPAETTCCEPRGLCVGAADAHLCDPSPPEGTVIGCADDADCQRYTGEWWGLPRLGTMFCDGPSCDGPGGCRAPTSCPGTLAAVCGCDGATYQNACEAARALVRVAHEGSC